MKKGQTKRDIKLRLYTNDESQNSIYVTAAVYVVVGATFVTILINSRLKKIAFSSHPLNHKILKTIVLQLKKVQKTLQNHRQHDNAGRKHFNRKKSLCLNWSKPQKHFNILIFVVLSVADASINKLCEFKITQK